MRAIVISITLVAFLAGSAVADPAAPATHRAKPTPAAATRLAPTSPNLFPTHVLGTIAGRRTGFTGRRASAERHPAFRFDTGKGWKGQAVAAGAMVGAFALLAAICSGGACMLR